MAGRLTLAKAGLLSAKTLRNEIVQDVDQMGDIQTGAGEYASANTVFPAVNLEAPTEHYWTLGGTAAPMEHTPYAAEAPLGALGDVDEEDVTTKGYKKMLAPEKQVDTELNSRRQVLSLYEWAAGMLRTELFLTREQVAWQGDEVTDGLIGTDGNTPHPAIPTSSHVIDPGTQYSDHDASTPYRDLSYASYILDETHQGFMDGDAPSGVQMFVSPSVWQDMKLNADMADRFSGVEVRGLSGDQVNSLIDSEIPTVRKIRVRIPRRVDGDYVDEDGNTVEDIDAAAMDNVLEPYDPSANAGAGANRRNIVIGTPGRDSAFIPFFTENFGDFDDANAPTMASGFATDRQRGFVTQTWVDNNPVVTFLKAMQDIGFHLMLPKHWTIIRDV